MTYYGLQPLLSNSNLPKVLQSPLGLYVSNSNYLLPCVINNIEITNEYSIPTHPIDSNQFIGDTIIKKPTSISLELYVYEENENVFHDLLAQGLSKGFYFVNRTKALYENLYPTNKSLTFSSEKYGGFICALELQEILKVSTQESFATLPKQSKKVDAGQVSPKKLEEPKVKELEKKSCLKKAKDQVGGDGSFMDKIGSTMAHCTERALGQVGDILGSVTKRLG